MFFFMLYNSASTIPCQYCMSWNGILSFCICREGFSLIKYEMVHVDLQYLHTRNLYRRGLCANQNIFSGQWKGSVVSSIQWLKNWKKRWTDYQTKKRELKTKTNEVNSGLIWVVFPTFCTNWLRCEYGWPNLALRKCMMPWRSMFSTAIVSNHRC